MKQILTKEYGFFGSIKEIVQGTVEDLTQNGLKATDANDGIDILATEGKVQFKVDYDFGHELSGYFNAQGMLFAAMEEHINSFVVLRMVLGMIKKAFHFDISSVEETVEYDENDYPFYIIEIEWTITDSEYLQEQ